MGVCEIGVLSCSLLSRNLFGWWLYSLPSYGVFLRISFFRSVFSPVYERPSSSLVFFLFIPLP